MKKNYPNSKFYFSREKFLFARYFSCSQKLKANLTSLIFAITGLLLLSSLSGTAQTVVNINTSGAGTFTVPCGVTSIQVEVWGGGGAGGGTGLNTAGAGAGGAGGAYALKTFAVTGGQTINYSVGTGGFGNITAAAASGNPTWFSSNAILNATGGQGAPAFNTPGTGSSVGCIGDVVLPGTSGSSGVGSTTGQGGAGGSGSGIGGAGGASIVTENNGAPGTSPGGAGSGALVTDNSDHTGGSGGAGGIRITYTAVFQNYCTPTFTTIEPIASVSFAGMFNASNSLVNNSPAYQSFCNVATVIQGSATNSITIKGNTNGNWTNYIRVYIDWDQNGTFGNNANEIYDVGTITNSTGVDAVSLTGNIAVPITALTGATRMRVIKNFAGYATECSSNSFGQAEDYTVNVTPLTACSTPTAQPTALVLTPGTPSGTAINGSFTAAAPASDSYLVIVSTFATPPASPPVNGTSYAIGSSVSSGYIVVDNDNNTTFTARGLATNTTYYFYVYSFNGLCSGGPLYYTTGPLTANATTTAIAPSYCTTATSTSSGVYINTLRSVGTITDASNSPTGYTAGGYANYSGITIATQIPGGGINLEIILAGTYSNPPCNGSSSQFIKTWVDWNKDGDFDDAGEQVYISGTDATPIATAIDNIYGFVVPQGTFPGNYRMRVRTRAYCDGSAITSCGALPTGETEDYTIRIVEDCPSKILSVTGGSACGPTNTVTLNATKTASATGFRWYTTLTGGAPIATTAVGTWTTPSIGVTTTYYVTAYDGVCETIHRTPVVATILPTTNITVTPSVPEVCGENNVVQISATGDFVTETLLLQDFESGMAPFTVTNPLLTNAGADTPWSVKTSPYIPATTTVWRPAVNSGAVGTLGNKFAFTTSDYQSSNIETIMTSPSINASLYTSLTLTYNNMYGAFSGDTGRLEVSVNGGAFSAVERTYTTDIGTPSVFASESVNFNAYAGVANLRFRFRYVGQWDDGWAIDNIKLEGVRPLNTTFTWGGGAVDAFIDAACTIPYVAQSVTTVYVRPNATQLAAASWSFTATATLGNGCPVSQLITIDNKTKIWKGASSNDWNNPNNWSPVGVPDANTCVIVYDGPFDSNVLSNVPAFAKTVIVRPLGDLQVHPNNNLTITDGLTVDANGIFKVRDTGSLLQVNNVANSGTMTMERISKPMYALDYTYWNSPVTAASGFTLGNLTTATSFIFNYTPTQAGGNGIWSAQSAATVMNPTRGYIARAPLGFPTSGAKQTTTVNFVGTLNNGDISMAISKGTNANIGSTVPSGGSTVVTDADDEWNLIGNPYPSAIDIVSFLNHPTNTPVVDGTVYLWTHNTPPTAATPDPFYGNYVLNYTVNDYATVNLSGATTTAPSGGSAPSRYIGAGQSFFISADNAMANGTTANVLFNNSMRVSGNNNNFMRSENETQAPEGFEAKRLWLNLSNNAGGFSQILVGYITGATLGWDRGFDGEALAGNAVKFYSLGADKKLTIQGRPWPFVQEDIVPLGFKATAQNNYTIGIDHLDPDFNNQNIYLEDRLLNIVHDLKSAPYSFTSAAGTFDSRFVLRYTENTLSNNDITALENTVSVFANDRLNVKSTLEPIKEIIVYDLLGRVLTNSVKINANEFTISNLNPTETTLIVKVTLENNAVITKKVIY